MLLLASAAAGASSVGPGRGDGHQRSDGAVDLEALDGFVPVGGGKFEVCDEDSGLDVQFGDDFATPVEVGFVLVDPVNTAGQIDTFSFPASRGLEPGTRMFSPTGVWFRYHCGGDYYLLPEGGPAVTIGQLVYRAVAELDPPDPPLAVTPWHGRHLVRAPSWLAIDQAYWDENRSERVEAGRVVVTAELNPFEMVWDMGNGETHVCDNPGTKWRKGMSEDQSDCSYTYRQASWNPPTHKWDLTGTVRFEVSHTTNAPGSYGPWVPVERSTVDTIEVVEVQAVGVSSG